MNSKLSPLNQSRQVTLEVVVNLLEVSNNGELRIVAKGDDELVDRQSEDTELGGAPVVQFHGALLELCLLVERVPAEVDPAVAEVSDKLVACSRNVAQEGSLEDADEGDDLHNPGRGDVVGADDRGDAVGVARKGVARVVNVAREVNAGTGGDLSQEGKHGNAAVLELDVSEAVEAFLVGVAQLSEGIEEAEGGLDSEFVLEGVRELGARRSLLRGRGKGSSRGEDGGGDGDLHVCGNSTTRNCEHSRGPKLQKIFCENSGATLGHDSTACNVGIHAEVARMFEAATTIFMLVVPQQEQRIVSIERGDPTCESKDSREVWGNA